ncbi:unnamed protein product [marine sediment metagenome]|uniref:Uncharacterized protein n=1 Tax=marine sediment metagenome TaxID=412755 RepID=X1PVH1_9ZZZZ
MDKGKDAKAEVQKALEKIKELAKVPKCKLVFTDDGAGGLKASVVCATKDDVGIASKAIIAGIEIELKPEVKIVE